jgi:hypothetical protein
VQALRERKSGNGTIHAGIPHSSSLLLGVRVPADSDSGFEAMWNAAVSAILNAFDAYGWIVPATLLAVLFLGVFCCFAGGWKTCPLSFPCLKAWAAFSNGCAVHGRPSEAAIPSLSELQSMKAKCESSPLRWAFA